MNRNTGGSATIKALETARLLQESRLGLTAAELALKTGVCERTVRRHLWRLQAAGWALYDEVPDKDHQHGPAAAKWFSSAPAGPERKCPRCQSSL